jgi:hypothetical protein
MHMGGGGMTPNPSFAADEQRAAPDKDAAIMVSCKAGGRSAKAAAVLEGLGYTRHRDQVGGWSGGNGDAGWVASGGPSATARRCRAAATRRSKGEGRAAADARAAPRGGVGRRPAASRRACRFYREGMGMAVDWQPDADNVYLSYGARQPGAAPRDAGRSFGVGARSPRLRGRGGRRRAGLARPRRR